MKAFIVALFLPAVLSLAAGAQTPHRAAAASHAPLVLKAVIALPGAQGRMDHMSVDLKGKRVFLSEIGNGGVAVVNYARGKAVHLLTGFGEPQGTYFEDSSNRLFVASGDDGAVRIFNGTTFKLEATAKFTIDADDLRFDPGTHHVLVGYSGQKFVGGKPVAGPGGEGDGAIGWVDAAGGHGTLVPVAAHPEAFEIANQGTRVYINVPDHHEIEVGDLATHQVVAHWPVSCTDNFPMALDQAHHRLFIGCRLPAKMLVFDTDTGATVASLPIPATADDMFFDPARRRIYVLGGQGYVAVIAEQDPNHYRRLAWIRARVGSRTGLFVPQLNELFVAISQSPHQHPELLVYHIQ